MGRVDNLVYASASVGLICSDVAVLMLQLLHSRHLERADGQLKVVICGLMKLCVMSLSSTQIIFRNNTSSSRRTAVRHRFAAFVYKPVNSDHDNQIFGPCKYNEFSFRPKRPLSYAPFQKDEKVHQTPRGW